MKRNILPIILLTITSILTWHYAQSIHMVYSATFSAQIPKEILGYQGRDYPLDSKSLINLGTRDVLFRIYEKAGQAPLYLCIVFAEDNRKAVHPPEVCYLGTGFEVVQKSRVQVGNLNLVRLLVQQEMVKELNFYSFKVGDVYSASFIQQQINIVLGRLKNKRVASGLVRVFTHLPLENGEVVEQSTLEFFQELKRIMDEKNL